MLRQFMFLGCAVCLATLPMAAIQNEIDVDSNPKLLGSSDDCYQSNLESVDTYEPKIESRHVERVILQCHLPGTSGYLRAYRYSFKPQEPGIEAVHSSHRIVDRTDLQRFGRTLVNTPHGQVWQARISARHHLGYVWHWYELDGEVIARSSTVKLREFATALLLQPEVPELFVLQWLPSEHVPFDSLSDDQILSVINTGMLLTGHQT